MLIRLIYHYPTVPGCTAKLAPKPLRPAQWNTRARAPQCQIARETRRLDTETRNSAPIKTNSNQQQKTIKSRQITHNDRVIITFFMIITIHRRRTEKIVHEKHCNISPPTLTSK